MERVKTEPCEIYKQRCLALASPKRQNRIIYKRLGREESSPAMVPLPLDVRESPASAGDEEEDSSRISLGKK